MATVLLVEDQRTQRELMAATLSQDGLKVITAADGREALQKLQETRPDVVVLDVVMPNMNGYEFLREIRKQPDLAKLPVVVCSVKGEQFDKHWAERLGSNAYVVKPFEPQVLVGTVRSLLRGVSR
ncbi:response regulator [Synechococcus sp. C9]|jgi:twitching motility two-component system response regulator PilH|uniref:response regulator transcription factor n=1 Tax=Synechococcus sp. C9 TaxID=102119 RepID=UPI001FF47B91|nr:response regulator [Synechococcus sp. C9]